MLGDPKKKWIKESEYKEIELAYNELDQRNAEYYAQVQKLKEDIQYYKEDRKERAREIDANFEYTQKEKKDENEEEIIRF